jgi:hypothetical protein
MFGTHDWSRVDRWDARGRGKFLSVPSSSQETFANATRS